MTATAVGTAAFDAKCSHGNPLYRRQAPRLGTAPSPADGGNTKGARPCRPPSPAADWLSSRSRATRAAIPPHSSTAEKFPASVGIVRTAALRQRRESGALTNHRSGSGASIRTDSISVRVSEPVCAILLTELPQPHQCTRHAICCRSRCGAMTRHTTGFVQRHRGMPPVSKG